MNIQPCEKPINFNDSPFQRARNGCSSRPKSSKDVPAGQCISEARLEGSRPRSRFCDAIHNRSLLRKFSSTQRDSGAATFSRDFVGVLRDHLAQLVPQLMVRLPVLRHESLVVDDLGQFLRGFLEPVNRFQIIHEIFPVFRRHLKREKSNVQ